MVYSSSSKAFQQYKNIPVDHQVVEDLNETCITNRTNKLPSQDTGHIVINNSINFESIEKYSGQLQEYNLEH